jgi:hypothetical protein
MRNIVILEATSLLLAQVNQYIHQVDGNPLGTTDPVIIGNISQLENSSVATELENKVVLTLVNLCEEAALKNVAAFSRSPSGVVNYQNPPVYLNLYLLFAATYNNYATALRRLAQVISFFQSKKTFTLSNSPGAVNNISPTTDLTLHIDLLSLNYEEVNNLWGSLGGKQLPFSLYRGRLIEMQDRRLLDTGGRIEQIDVQSGGGVS